MFSPGRGRGAHPLHHIPGRDRILYLRSVGLPLWVLAPLQTWAFPKVGFVGGSD